MILQPLPPPVVCHRHRLHPLNPQHNPIRLLPQPYPLFRIAPLAKSIQMRLTTPPPTYQQQTYKRCIQHKPPIQRTKQDKHRKFLIFCIKTVFFAAQRAYTANSQRFLADMPSAWKNDSISVLIWFYSIRKGLVDDNEDRCLEISPSALFSVKTALSYIIGSFANLQILEDTFHFFESLLCTKRAKNHACACCSSVKKSSTYGKSMSVLQKGLNHREISGIMMKRAKKRGTHHVSEFPEYYHF